MNQHVLHVWIAFKYALKEQLRSRNKLAYLAIIDLNILIRVRTKRADALRLIEVAKKYVMTGIGVKQNGPAAKRFIHLDNLGISYTKLTGGPRPWIWSYA